MLMEAMKKYWILPTDFKNDNGTTLAEEMMETMNDGLYDNMKENQISY